MGPRVAAENHCYWGVTTPQIDGGDWRFFARANRVIDVPARCGRRPTRTASGDIDIELVEHVTAEVLEVLLHLHFDILPREVRA